jgi:hypothetical protein
MNLEKKIKKTSSAPRKTPRASRFTQPEKRLLVGMARRTSLPLYALAYSEEFEIIYRQFCARTRRRPSRVHLWEELLELRRRRTSITAFLVPKRSPRPAHSTSKLLRAGPAGGRERYQMHARCGARYS